MTKDDRCPPHGEDLVTGLLEGPFHPTTLHEGISAWVIVLKDLYKRLLMALEEGDLLVGSLRFLNEHRLGTTRAEPPGNEPKMFRSLHRSMTLAIAWLRDLREKVRDDLIVVEMLLAPSTHYEDLSHVDEDREGDQDQGSRDLDDPMVRRIVLPRPKGEKERGRVADAWATALRVLRRSSLRAIWAAPSVMHPEGSVRKRFFDQLPPLDDIRLPQVLLYLKESSVFQPERFMREKLRGSDGALPESERLAPVTVETIAGELSAWLSDRKGGWTHAKTSISRDVEGSGSIVEIVDALRDDPRRDDVCAAIVDEVIEIAEGCWQQRRRDVLLRVARYRSSNVPEGDGQIINGIHEDFFLRIQRYQAEFTQTLASLSMLFGSFQQKASLLPPNFPPVPRFHRREREAVYGALQTVVDRLQESTTRLVEVIKPKRLPKLFVELTFDYTFTSHVRELRLTPDAKAATIVVPFFFIEVPRYTANIVHEIAHLLLPCETIEELLGADRREWRELKSSGVWNVEVATPIRAAGGKLHRMYRRYGSPRARFLEEGLIAEVIADFIALWIVGPHFLDSLLFTTLGLTGLRGPGSDDEPTFENPSEVHPMVRIGALLAAARQMWPSLFGRNPSGAHGKEHAESQRSGGLGHRFGHRGQLSTASFPWRLRRAAGRAGKATWSRSDSKRLACWVPKNRAAAVEPSGRRMT